MSIRIRSLAGAAAGAGLIAAAILASGTMLQDRHAASPAPFDDAALMLGLEEIRALAEAVIVLEAPRRSVDGAAVHEIERLPRVDQRFPRGLPLSAGGTVLARLVSLTYKDAGLPGLSRGDELRFLLETSSASGTCRVEYRFDWDDEDRIAAVSPGPRCSPITAWPAHRGQATDSATASLEAFADDVRLVARLVAAEFELRGR